VEAKRTWLFAGKNNVMYVAMLQNLVKNFELIEATCSSYIHILVHESRFQAYTFVQASNMQNWLCN
jgi:hypothetical protein